MPSRIDTGGAQAHHRRPCPALEHRLEARLLEQDRLYQTRPRLPTALARADAGQRIDELLGEVRGIQRQIALSPATSLQDAAVKLRLIAALAAPCPCLSRPGARRAGGTGTSHPGACERQHDERVSSRPAE